MVRNQLANKLGGTRKLIDFPQGLLIKDPQGERK
jgi:hypothetical protein